jgi:hypothetical protein
LRSKEREVLLKIADKQKSHSFWEWLFLELSIAES